MKKLSKLNIIFLFLFSLGLSTAYGQSGHGSSTHKNFNELEQGYKQCEKMTGQEQDLEQKDCFRKLYPECSKTANYCRERYGLRDGKLPEQCGEVISLRLKVLSKANSLNPNK